MDLSKDELDFTKTHRNMVKYTKLAGKGKGLTGEQFLEFYQVYCELYDLLCEYMNRYNELEEKYNITISFEDKGIKDIEYYFKKGDKWYAHYKETQVDKTKTKELEELSKSNITEKELKDMIIGMLE